MSGIWYALLIDGCEDGSSSQQGLGSDADRASRHADWIIGRHSVHKLGRDADGEYDSFLAGTHRFVRMPDGAVLREVVIPAV